MVDDLLLEILAKRAMTSLNSNLSLRCFVGLLLVAAAVVVLLFCCFVVLLFVAVVVAFVVAFVVVGLPVVLC